MTYTCPNGCPARWKTDDPCPLCGAPGEGLPEDAKRPQGRPPRGGTERRFRVVMTDQEHEALTDKAQAAGLPVAELIRQIAPVLSPR